MAEEEFRTPYVLLLFGTLVFISFLLGKVVHRYHIRFLSESGVTMLVGLFVGFCDRFIFRQGFGKSVRFDTTLFEYFILPAIIFFSGYSLKKRGLFKNFLTILLYAIPGTLISTTVVGLGLWGVARAGISSVDPSSPIEGLVYGSIISATDPVSTIALFTEVFELGKRLEAPTIHNLIFGESILNDAVAIVLFRIFSSFLGRTSFGAGDFFMAMVSFVYIFFGSLIIGCLIGFLSALVFKYISFRDDNVFEVLIMTMMAFSSYLVAEALGLSGILALFFCGIIMGHYTWYNVSEYSKLTTPQTFRAFATLADTYVFLYLGMAAFSFYEDLEWRWAFIFIALGLCLVGRALNIFPLSLIANFWRQEKVNLKTQFFVWNSGLRGAIAFTLALQLNYSGKSPNSSAIVACTIFIVVLTTIGIGGFSYPLLKLLKLIPEDENSDFTQVAVLMVNRAEVGPRAMSVGVGKKGDRVWQNFERNYMRSWFRRADSGKLSSYLRTMLLGGSIASSLTIGEISHNSTELNTLQGIVGRVSTLDHEAEEENMDIDSSMI